MHHLWLRWAALIGLLVVILWASDRRAQNTIDEHAREVQRYNCQQLVDVTKIQDDAILAVVKDIPPGQVPSIDQLREDLARVPLHCDDDGRLVLKG